MKTTLFCVFLSLTILSLFMPKQVRAQDENCITCHSKISPGQVRDWKTSKHAENEVTCSVCHGEEHQTAADYKKVQLPDEEVCADCHEEQYESFSKGKHNHGWSSLNTIPAAHFAPDELTEGGRGCGGCHNMGIKSAAQKKDQRDKGWRYQNNSCDECHTRHSFSKKEAQNPRACQQCHMGYDHPQWEMWSSSKHGERYFAKEAGLLPEKAPAPTCQHCHFPEGSHENHTSWGFLGVRLPLPKDKQAARDRETILKALAVLNPETNEPGPFYAVIEKYDMVRLSDEAWQSERNKMYNVCSECHSEAYIKEQLQMGDAMVAKTDRLMAEAIRTVAGLYKDHIIKKPESYPYNYPFLLSYMHTNGAGWDKKMDDYSYIDQILLQMFMKHRMRAYQGMFHVNPDYAYWYGWEQMTKDLGEIKHLASVMRAEHKK